MTVKCESAPRLPRASGPRRGDDPFDFILAKISPPEAPYPSAAQAAQNRSLT